MRKEEQLRSQSTPTRVIQAKLHTLPPKKVHCNRRSLSVQYPPITVHNEQHPPTIPVANFDAEVKSTEGFAL